MALERLGKNHWRLKPTGDMRVPAEVYAGEEMIGSLEGDGTLNQLRGVATLPGILGRALAMPDAHQGYGFPIGGVAAFDEMNGVVSPGGVGYDINCGVRLLRSQLVAADLGEARLERLVDQLAVSIPAGVGIKGEVSLSEKEMDRILKTGAGWAVSRGLGNQTDLEFSEDRGCIPGADTEMVSARARNRGRDQAGTLGAGNHFVEIALVEEIFDADAAGAFGLVEGMAVFWLHTGSRGLGHQVCDDQLKDLPGKEGVVIPKDRQLVSAALGSKAAQAYLSAMAAAANFAFNNRQMLTHLVRETVERTLNMGPARLGMGLVYDVAHNIAKFESHLTEGKMRRVLVHRKGATRSLGPGHELVPSRYRAVGQPVLLPGDMGRASYVLAGTEKAEAETFGSAAHGAGRRLSRTQAKKEGKGRDVQKDLKKQGVLVRAHSRATLLEEMPLAYKDVSRVAEILHQEGIAKVVARTRPMAVVKG